MVMAEETSPSQKETPTGPTSLGQARNLLIGGSDLKLGRVSSDFFRIGDDYTSLAEANEVRPLDSYERIVIWPTTTAFDFAKNQTQFGRLTPKRFPGSRIKPCRLVDLHAAFCEERRRINWEGPPVPFQLLDELKSMCVQLLAPLVRRVLRGGPPIVVVASEPERRTPVPLWDWFCPQLQVVPTAPSAHLTPFKASHPLHRFFNSILPCFTHMEIALSVIQRCDGEEFGVDCLGKALSIGALNPQKTFNSHEEFEWYVEHDTPYSGVVDVVGLRADFSGYIRAIALTHGSTGILVIPPPQRVQPFFSALCGNQFKEAWKASPLTGTEPAATTLPAPSDWTHKEWLSVREAAALKGKSGRTICQWIKDRQLPSAKKIKGQWRILQKELDQVR